MLILNASTGFGAGTATAYDPYFANVVLLIQPTYDRPGIPDLSPAGRPVLVTGTTNFSTVTPWPGGRSIMFTGDNWLSCTDSDDFHMPGDYVIETLFKPYDLSASRPILTQDSVASDCGFTVGTSLQDGGRVWYTQHTSSGVNRVTTTTAPATNGTWTHVAVVKSGPVLSIYVNGTKEAEAAAAAMRNGAGELMIGAGTDGGTSRYYGTIAGIRITRGTSRGLGGATIPVPAALWPTA